MGLLPGKRFLLATGFVLVLGAAYILDVPVPDGYRQPIRLRLKLGFIKALTKVLDAYSIISGYDSIHMLRALTEDFGERQPLNPRVKITKTQFDGVPVHIFEPLVIPGDTEAMKPAVMFIHGGGWITSSASVYRELCSWFAEELQMKFFSIDYRLAPEHVYPAGLDDCVMATKYLMLHGASQYGIDPDRLAISGDSAGGNLATAVSLRLRDEGFIKQPKLQLLLYPCLQALDFHTPSYQQHPYHPLLPRASMAKFWLLYVEGNSDKLNYILNNTHTKSSIEQFKYIDHSSLPLKYFHKGYQPVPHNRVGDESVWYDLETYFLDPYVAPLMEPNLSKLPAAYVLTCEHDVLRDDGTWYAQRLRQAGVKVHHRTYQACYHGIATMSDSLDAIAIRTEIANYIKKEL